jgi:FixJ family two-component response regulator
MALIQPSPLRSRRQAVSDTRPTVFVVDDDISVRESLEALVCEAGWRPQLFVSAEDFLNHPRQRTPGCLVLDVSLPDLDGLELQARVAENQANMPIIFITGHGDIPMSVRAMKAGAVEFLTKPVRPETLVSAIRSAIERSRTALAEQSEVATLRERHNSLTPRERDVMALVVRGRLNKQVAAELGINEITVKHHRGSAMHKMKVRSLAELVRIAGRLGLPTGGSG